MSKLTQERLHQLFRYEDGKLFRVLPRRSVHVGSRAGSPVKKTGYRQISVDMEKHQEHRIIFMMHHGYFPKYIDHINRVKDDNRIENLREANPSENARNIQIPTRKNKSGVIGVSWDKDRGSWRTQLKVDGRAGYLGRFKSFSDAVKCRTEAERRLFPDHYPVRNYTFKEDRGAE